MRKNFKIVKIDDPEALEYISRCEVYQAISDYDKNSKGAKAYESLASEIIKRTK